jgi:hypothetical protein
MNGRVLIPLAFCVCTLAATRGAEGPPPAPTITDNSPASLAIAWRNDTGIPCKFGPSVDGLCWEYRGTTKLGLELRLSGAFVPAFNDIRVARFEPRPPYARLAQWQFAVDASLQGGVASHARGGGVRKEPASDGLLPGFKSVTFTLTPDLEGSGWTACLTWSNSAVVAPK